MGGLALAVGHAMTAGEFLVARRFGFDRVRREHASIGTCAQGWVDVCLRRVGAEDVPPKFLEHGASQNEKSPAEGEASRADRCNL
jgi:hypothetical protein